MSTGLFQDEEDGYNLEETKYKLKLDAPESAPAFGDSDDSGLDAFDDAGSSDDFGGDFGEEGGDDFGGGDKPFDDEPFDADVEADEDEDPEKYIQQLAGKLGTSLRKYNDERGEADFDLEKYVINSVISASHTSEMEETDQKDIIRKVKTSGAESDVDDSAEGLGLDDEKSDEPGGEEDFGGEEEGGEDFDFGDEKGLEETMYEEDTMTINLKNMKQDAEDILSLDVGAREKKLKGHKWADDHISTSADDAEEVADFLTNEGGVCWDGYERVPGTKEGAKGSCRKKTSESLMEAEYKGKKVELNKPTSGDVKKYKVFVKNDKGNVIKVNFGDKNMEIRRDNDEARKSFRARHKCSEKKDKTTAGYWSCKMWSNKKVSDIVGENLHESKKSGKFVKNDTMKDIILNKLHETIEPAPVKPKVDPAVKPSRRKRIWETKPSVKPKPKMEIESDEDEMSPQHKADYDEYLESDPDTHYCDKCEMYSTVSDASPYGDCMCS